MKPSGWLPKILKTTAITIALSTSVSLAFAYTVRPGETLSQIVHAHARGEKLYGADGALAKTLALNPHVEKNGSLIYPGQSINLVNESDLRAPASDVVVVVPAAQPVVIQEAAAPVGSAAPAAGVVPETKSSEPTSGVKLEVGVSLRNTTLSSVDSNGNKANLVLPFGVSESIAIVHAVSDAVDLGVEFEHTDSQISQNARASVLTSSVALNSYGGFARYHAGDQTMVALRVGSDARGYVYSPSIGSASVTILSPLALSLKAEQSIASFKKSRVSGAIEGRMLLPTSDASVSTKTGYGGELQFAVETDLGGARLRSHIAYGYESQDTSVSKQTMNQYGIGFKIVLPIGGSK